MSELFVWLSNYPVATATILSLFSVLIISIVLVYIVAFFQGREISFWPPKIGEMPGKSSRKGGKGKEITLSKQKNEYLQEDIDGLTVFHINRNKLPALDRTLGLAEREILLLAVQHSALIHQCLGLLQKKADAGCRVKILMMAARDSEGNINTNAVEIESHRRYTGVLEQLDSSIKTFQAWLSCLSVSARERVEIRTYLGFPVTSFIFIDSDTPTGFVLVELPLYGIHVHDMPHYIVTRQDSEQFFEVHLESFDMIWRNSQPLEPVFESDVACKRFAA